MNAVGLFWNDAESARQESPGQCDRDSGRGRREPSSIRECEDGKYNMQIKAALMSRGM